MRVRHVLGDQARRQQNQSLHVRQINLLIQRFGTNSTVKRATIEVGKIKMRSEAARQRALARSCRTVDGDNHPSLAPKPLNSVTKVGKDVRMQFLSSIVMPLSETIPSTSVDMARR